MRTFQRSQGFNTLQLAGVRATVLWPGFPYVFQAFLLAAFIGLAALSWGVMTPPGVSAKLFAKTHLATLLIWGLWWPAMIWVAVFFGRVWCMVCPLELVSHISERLAGLLRFPRRPLRKWVSSGTVIVVLYAVIQWLVAGAHINRVPAYTSLFLIGLLALATLTGLLFKDRAMCRGFCPVGLLLATYGRGGMLAIRAGSRSACDACATKGCLASRNRMRLDGRSCPSLLNPPKVSSNTDCLICGQCIKACERDNMLINMQLVLRRPFPACDVREPAASWPVTLFVMLVSGFVIWELCTEWPFSERVFLTPPVSIAGLLGVPEAGGWFVGGWVLAVVPLALWSTLAGVMRLVGDRRCLPDLWRRLALPMAVVVSAGHMSKGLAKFVSWAPFLPQALRDPHGLNTVTALAARSLAPPAAFLDVSTVAVICLPLVCGALLFALREYRLAQPDEVVNWRATPPLLGFTAVLAFLVIGWMDQ